MLRNYRFEPNRSLLNAFMLGLQCNYRMRFYQTCKGVWFLPDLRGGWSFPSVLLVPAGVSEGGGNKKNDKSYTDPRILP